VPEKLHKVSPIEKINISESGKLLAESIFLDIVEEEGW
jgi:hypothetical protein